jgi:hypothetical protein
MSMVRGDSGAPLSEREAEEQAYLDRVRAEAAGGEAPYRPRSAEELFPGPRGLGEYLGDDPVVPPLVRELQEAYRQRVNRREDPAYAEEQDRLRDPDSYVRRKTFDELFPEDRPRPEPTIDDLVPAIQDILVRGIDGDIGSPRPPAPEVAPGAAPPAEEGDLAARLRAAGFGAQADQVEGMAADDALASSPPSFSGPATDRALSRTDEPVPPEPEDLLRMAEQARVDGLDRQADMLEARARELVRLRLAMGGDAFGDPVGQREQDVYGRTVPRPDPRDAMWQDTRDRVDAPEPSILDELLGALSGFAGGGGPPRMTPEEEARLVEMLRAASDESRRRIGGM